MSRGQDVMEEQVLQTVMKLGNSTLVGEDDSSVTAAQEEVIDLVTPARHLRSPNDAADDSSLAKQANEDEDLIDITYSRSKKKRTSVGIILRATLQTEEYVVYTKECLQAERAQGAEGYRPAERCRPYPVYPPVYLSSAKFSWLLTKRSRSVP